MVTFFRHNVEHEKRLILKTEIFETRSKHKKEGVDKSLFLKEVRTNILIFNGSTLQVDKAQLAKEHQSAEQIKSLRNQLAAESRVKGQLQGTW